MRLTTRSLGLVFAIALSLIYCGQAHAAPTITSLSQTSGTVGTSITITGSNFGSTQGTSTLTFNGTSATPTSWSATSIVVPVPSGATTGNVVVTVSGVASNGLNFYVAQTLMGSWQDVDMGSVGAAGSASYSNGVFSVAGAGTGISGTSDKFNFLFQSLSGDGTIVARVLSLSGGTSPQAGVMIRETLFAGAIEGSENDWPSSGLFFSYRTTTSATTSNASGGFVSPPFW